MPIRDRFDDDFVRAAAFEWLTEQTRIYTDVLPRKVLEEGFELHGTRIPLVGPQGIFKPRVLAESALSITTVPGGPYDDSFGPDGLLRYKYRGTNPDHVDNRGLRMAMAKRRPLVYFHGIIPGRYMAVWPVFIVGDSPTALSFSVAVDDATHLTLLTAVSDPLASPLADADAGRRRYVTALVKQRLHQRAFRERVINAYHRQCAFCKLRHEELLDAAHIIPDIELEGEPVVPNGLSLCKLHHAAFDHHFLGVRPDYVLQVHPDILKEKDGPTLVHAFQALHGVRLQVPRQPHLQPEPRRLEVRFDRFLKAQSNLGLPST